MHSKKRKPLCAAAARCRLSAPLATPGWIRLSMMPTLRLHQIKRTCGAAGEKDECFRASAVGSFRSPPMWKLKLCTGTRAAVRGVHEAVRLL